MKVEFLEVLCEEPSAEIALRGLLTMMLASTEVGFEVHSFRGKSDLLKKLPQRLDGYSRWLPEGHKILILVDRDRDDCEALKRRLKDIVLHANLTVHSVQDGQPGQVLPRILVEELESWFFGDAEALRAAFPKLPSTLAKKAKFRLPDVIESPWEALERTLQRHGYFQGGYRKRDAARAISAQMDPARNRSRSFQVFRDGILDLVR